MTTDDAEEMRELVAALKHDLAKYVAWRSANFDEAVWTGPLQPDFVEALQADVLETSSGAPAWKVWERHTAGLRRPLPHPELVSVEGAVMSLAASEAVLRAGPSDALASHRSVIREAQLQIRAELKALHRRLAEA